MSATARMDRIVYLACIPAPWEHNRTGVKESRNLAILDLYLAGMTGAEIAARCGIGGSRVGAIIKSTLRRHDMRLRKCRDRRPEIDEAHYRRPLSNAEFFAVARFIHDAAWCREDGARTRCDAHMLAQWNRFADWVHG